MRKSLSCLAIASFFLALPLAADVATAAAPAGKNVRQELASFFRNIDSNSPTVLGGLKQSPETMKAIEDRIASMSDAEVAAFAKLTAQTPDWKVAPEALAHAFPPEMREHIQRVGDGYKAEVPKGEAMRDDVLSLVAVLKVLPDEKLKDAGITREMVASLEGTFQQMSPLEAAMLQRQAGDKVAWSAAGSAAVNSMPHALRRGAAALAEHGPITTADIDELEKFRGELTALFRRIDALPEGVRATLKADSLREQVHHLNLAPPDAIFMVRHNIPPEMIQTLSDSVQFFERVAALSDAEKAELEAFRGDLTGIFNEEELLSSLDPAQLLVLKQGLDSVGDWKTALPAFYGALASPELAGRIRAVQGSDADPAALAEAESFRAEALALVDQMSTEEGVTAAMAGRARQALQAATPERLQVMRTTLERLPAATSASGKITAVLLQDINFNCSVDFPSPLPDLSLDFICNPIEDMLETVRDGVVSTVNTIVAGVRSALESTINAVSSALNTAISAVTNTVNSIISSIQSLANQIWSFITTVPDLAWNAIKSALNLLLDIQIKNGVTLRDLVARGVEHALTSMKTLLGLTEGWWNAVSSFTLPAIPCPPAGFHTPFGDVGDGAAADNYARYKLVIDGIIGMIPDTETSLAIKIPAQVLYMAFDFLGLCLDQADAERKAETLTSRHNIVLTNFTNLQSYVGAQFLGLTNQTTSQTNALTNLINQQASNVQNTMLSNSVAIQALLRAKGISTRNTMTSESSEIQNLIQTESDDTQSDLADFQKLNLRTVIERALQAGVTNEIASLQLLEPFGYLGVVRDLVRETIDAMSATQQGVGQAQRFFETAVSLLNSGREKDAFKEFSKAYQAATR